MWLQEDFVALRKRLELKSLEPVRTHSLTRVACPLLAAVFSRSGAPCFRRTTRWRTHRSRSRARRRKVRAKASLANTRKQAVLSRCLLRSEADIALFGGDPDRPSSISARDPSLAPEFESTQPSG